MKTIKTILVYYRRVPTFAKDTELTKDQVLDGETHEFVKRFKDVKLASVFSLMQGEAWSPNGEARDLIKRKGLCHTSMSVGDCAYDAEEDILYQCCPFGWEVVK